MKNFDLLSFGLGIFAGCLIMLLIGCFILLIDYFCVRYKVIDYILKNKIAFEINYFKINDYYSAKAVFKLLSSKDKNEICKTLDITSYWDDNISSNRSN